MVYQSIGKTGGDLMSNTDFNETITNYKSILNEEGKLNLSLDECRKLYDNDYYIVVKDGFVMDIKNKE